MLPHGAGLQNTRDHRLGWTQAAITGIFAPVAPSDRLTLALMAQLRETGALSDEDLAAIADRVDGAGEVDADLAHRVRCVAIEAAAPAPADWEAARRRERFTVVEKGGQ